MKLRAEASAFFRGLRIYSFPSSFAKSWRSHRETHITKNNTSHLPYRTPYSPPRVAPATLHSSLQVRPFNPLFSLPFSICCQISSPPLPAVLPLVLSPYAPPTSKKIQRGRSVSLIDAQYTPTSTPQSTNESISSTIFPSLQYRSFPPSPHPEHAPRHVLESPTRYHASRPVGAMAGVQVA